MEQWSLFLLLLFRVNALYDVTEIGLCRSRKIAQSIILDGSITLQDLGEARNSDEICVRESCTFVLDSQSFAAVLRFKIANRNVPIYGFG